MQKFIAFAVVAIAMAFAVPAAKADAGVVIAKPPAGTVITGTTVEVETEFKRETTAFSGPRGFVQYIYPGETTVTYTHTVAPVVVAPAPKPVYTYAAPIYRTYSCGCCSCPR